MICYEVVGHRASCPSLVLIFVPEAVLPPLQTDMPFDKAFFLLITSHQTDCDLDLALSFEWFAMCSSV